MINIQHIAETGAMPQIVIEFEWPVDPKGYHLVESERPMRVRRNGKGHAPEDFPCRRPLSQTDWLFKVFARLAIAPSGVLEFVRRYGSLTHDGSDEARGDFVDLVIHNAHLMQQLLESSSRYQKQPDLLPIPLQLSAISLLNASVCWDPITKRPKWELRPNTLLDALWLQLGQALTGSAQFRQCEHCGDWFEAGRGAGRRLDAKFCSDEHRIVFNSLKRSREK
jgi:hypothetical protein